MINSTLITLLGQTSSGKSDMSIALAKKLKNCWVVNCDSRQIYSQLDIGTGKITGEWIDGVFCSDGVKHFLIDYVDPQERYSLKNYLLDFNSLFEIPAIIPKYIILTGGTGLYADSIINRYELANLTDTQERDFQNTKSELELLSLEDLQKKYNENSTKIDKQNLNRSDYGNSRRIVNWLLRNDKRFNQISNIQIPFFNCYQNFAINIEPYLLQEKIKKRLVARFTDGLIEEVKNLNISSSRLAELGLEYKIARDFLNGLIPENELIERLYKANLDLAKKQKTWLQKRDMTWIKSADEIVEKLIC